MQTSKAFIFFLVNLLVVVLVTSSAFAQPAPGPEVVTSSTQILLERGGILGAVAVLEGLAIFLLFKDLKQQHEKTLEWAVKATDVLATAMAGAQKSEATQVRAMEQLAKNEAALAKNEAALARVAERMDNKGSGGTRVVE